jgi:hypothetical protein
MRRCIDFFYLPLLQSKIHTSRHELRTTKRTRAMLRRRGGCVSAKEGVVVAAAATKSHPLLIKGDARHDDQIERRCGCCDAANCVQARRQ